MVKEIWWQQMERQGMEVHSFEQGRSGNVAGRGSLEARGGRQRGNTNNTG